MEQNVESNVQDYYLWSSSLLTHSQIATVGYTPVDSTQLSGHHPKVQHWTSHFLAGKYTVASQCLQKHHPLDFLGRIPTTLQHLFVSGL